MLKRFPIGSDVTLMNTLYAYPKRDDETGKWDKGSMTLIYKDNTTGKKYTECIEDPDYEFYIQDTKYLENNEFFYDKKDLKMIKTPFRELEKTIAKLTNNENFYNNNVKSGQRKDNKKLHLVHSVFNSDMNIEDHYRFRFDKLYENEITPISKFYFDIEADTINMVGDFPEPGECPVNAVSTIDDSTKTIKVFLLRNKNNPLINQFEKDIQTEEMYNELIEFIKYAVGGYKQFIRFGLDKFHVEFKFYDEELEIELLYDLFYYINTIQPDFALAWNMAFDIPYLIARIENLGGDPKEFLCHPDFENKMCEYYIDERHKNEFAERGDRAYISSYTVYLDQMIHFASRRKGQSAFQSFGLDYIGETVTHVRKLDYSHITTQLAKLPYLDYKTFVFYNIMDTIVQKCIEVKTGDIDYVFSKCMVNNTRYDKCHRQTVYLVNRATKEFNKSGLVIGNNTNKFNDKPTEKFPGAFVADPRKLKDNAKMSINGVKVNLLNNLDDYDYKSLYPSIMREFNTAPNTQIGRVYIDQKVYDKENPFDNPYYVRGGAFLEDLQCGVYLEFCKRWLHLAGYGDLYKDVLDYANNIKPSMKMPRNFTRDGKIKVLRYLPKGSKKKVMSKLREGEKIKVWHYYKKPENFDIILNTIPRTGVVFNDY